MSIGAAPNKTGAKLSLRFRSSDLKTVDLRTRAVAGMDRRRRSFD